MTQHRIILFSFRYDTTCVLKPDFNTTLILIGAHQADEADYFKRVASTECVESWREALASVGAKRLVYLVNHGDGDQMNEVGANELP